MTNLLNICILIMLFLIVFYIIKIITTLNYTYIKKYLKTLYAKLNIFKDINKKIEYINYIFKLNTKFFNSFTLVLISFILGLISFVFFIIKFKILISSIIIFILVFLVSITSLDIVIKVIKSKILNEIYFYIINLKNFSIHTNDIILIMNKIKPGKFLNIYLRNFINLVNNGFDIVKAFDVLSNDIQIKEITTLIYMLKLCYINGGNLNNVLTKFNIYYQDINKIKRKQREKNITSLSVLFGIMVINIILVFLFAIKNIEYRDVILNSVLGKILFNLNSLIYLIIFIYIRGLIKKE